MDAEQAGRVGGGLLPPLPGREKICDLVYLIWRIFNAIKGIYGPESSHYLERTPELLASL